jgi:rhomboid family GlyGly-CTERM serine protease
MLILELPSQPPLHTWQHMARQVRLGLSTSAAALTLLSCALLLLPEALSQALSLERAALLQGDWWRLWTGHFVHFSIQHALINALVLFITGTIVEREIGALRFSAAIALICAFIGAGVMYLNTALLDYRGLSGIAVALTVAALFIVAQKKQTAKIYIGLLAIILCLKLLGEIFGVSSAAADLPTGIAVEWRAHLLGALAGLGLIAGLTLDSKLTARHHEPMATGG